jgi:hypothetical protein
MYKKLVMAGLDPATQGHNTKSATERRFRSYRRSCALPWVAGSSPAMTILIEI